MTLDELIALGERATQGEWRMEADPRITFDLATALKGPESGPYAIVMHERDSAYIAACSPSRLLPILRAAKQMRDVLANEIGMDDCPDAVSAIAAFDEAVNK